MMLSGRNTFAIAIAAVTMLSGCGDPKDKILAKIIEKAVITCGADMNGMAAPEEKTARIIAADEAAKRYEVTVTVASIRFDESGICTAIVQEGKPTKTSVRMTGNWASRKLD